MELTPRRLPLASGGNGACADKSSLLLSLQETLTAIAKNEQESSGLDMSFIAANRTNSELPPPPPDEVIPLQIVAQLVAGNMPRDSKVAKETKLLVQHSLTEFIAFVTSEAADICTSDKIRVTEIKQALTNLGLSMFSSTADCGKLLECPRVPKRKLPPGSGTPMLSDDDHSTLECEPLVRGVSDEDIDLLIAELEEPQGKRRRDNFINGLDLRDEWSLEPAW